MEITNKIIGIVGGMGPEAGLELLSRITGHTVAASDQEHLSTILMSFPSRIVDRSAYLNGQTTENPAYSIVEIIRKLELAGAQVVGIACNTSHSPAIYNVIESLLEKSKSHIQLVHMPYETCLYLQTHYKQVSKVGLLTTNGTYQSGLYKNILQRFGYEVVLPDSDFQHQVIHRMIYDTEFGIKANAGNITHEVKVLMDNALAFFVENGAEAISDVLSGKQPLTGRYI